MSCYRPNYREREERSPRQKGPFDVKRLQCYFWTHETCSWGSHCRYAHHFTGKVAEKPIMKSNGMPKAHQTRYKLMKSEGHSVAGKNATADRPVYKRWQGCESNQAGGHTQGESTSSPVKEPSTEPRSSSHKRRRSRSPPVLPTQKPKERSPAATVTMPLPEYENLKASKQLLQEQIQSLTAQNEGLRVDLSSQERMLRTGVDLLENGCRMLDGEGQQALDLSQKMQRGERISPDTITEAWLAATHLLQTAKNHSAMVWQWREWITSRAPPQLDAVDGTTQDHQQAEGHTS